MGTAERCGNWELDTRTSAADLIGGANEKILTGIHRQKHIRVVLVSEETFSDKVLHLCDGCAALKTGGQQER